MQYEKKYKHIFLILNFTICTYQSTGACLFPDPGMRFGTAVSSSGVRVEFIFGTASAYSCYNTLVKIKVEIKIKIILGLKKIERCKVYVSVLAIDTRRLTYIVARTTDNGTTVVVLKRVVE